MKPQRQKASSGAKKRVEKPVFKVVVHGKEKTYPITHGYGYFIPAFLDAENLTQIAASVQQGLPSKEIAKVIEFLKFKVAEIAKVTSVSASTVSRWKPETSIGPAGSSQFFLIDEVIRKGVAVFGGEEEFKGWLEAPNLAMGNARPADLILSPVGIELVDEALDALNYGNVI